MEYSVPDQEGLINTWASIHEEDAILSVKEFQL